MILTYSEKIKFNIQLVIPYQMVNLENLTIVPATRTVLK